jgi:ATP-binding cassette, subfamily B, bacterial
MTTPATAQPWRGLAADEAEEASAGGGALLHGRSRRLLADMLGRQRGRAILTMTLIVIASLAALAGPWLVGVGIDRGIPPLADHHDPGPLLALTAAFAVTVVVQAVATRAYIYATGRLGERIVLDLRRRLFTHFGLLSVSFHEDYTSGRVIARQTSDIDAISALFEDGLDSLVSAVLTLILVGAGMLLLDWPLGLVVLAGFGPLVWLTAWFRRESATAYRRGRESIAQVIVQFVETMTGIRAVQAFRRERRNDEIFGELNAGYYDASLRSFRLVALYAPGITLVGNVITGVVLGYGGLRVIDGDIKVGVLVTFLLYLRRFFDPLQDLAQFYNAFQGAGAALEKISGVLAEPPSVPSPARGVRLPDRRRSGRSVRFASVSFGYRTEPVIPRLDLDIPAGQTTALVGTTGAGKTTVARLLARFYDPDEGRVLLDGVDLRDLDDPALRSEVVMITQENFLFSGTIADNIALGNPSADRAGIEAAARAIGAGEFIAALPGGYDADVGKRGGRLSAGQRQLISFARAFLAAPAVLVLDEATSLLDIPSERMVQRALRTMLGGRTALIIAHRLSTVEIADRVLVLDRGQVVQDGPPARLLAGAGRFARMHQSWQDSLA